MNAKKDERDPNEASAEERTPVDPGAQEDPGATMTEFEGEIGREPEEAAADWRDKYLRALADLDNYRKRMERERVQVRRYAIEGLLRDLLPAIDHFELAVAADGEAEALRKGVRLALDDLMRILKDKGLEPIDAVGQVFDPRFHEAVGMEMDPRKAPNTVQREERRGYVFHDRVLRASRVHIVVAPPKATGEARKDDARAGDAGETGD